MRTTGAVRTLSILLLLLLALSISSAPASANSAEPPQFTVIVSSPPDELTLTLRYTDGTEQKALRLERSDRAWEAYYRFFSGSVPGDVLEGAELVVESGEYAFTCPLPESALVSYNNVYTLDLRAGTLAEGQAAGRQVLLVSLRVVLTLLIESVVFLAFGYRKLRSWVIFLLVNLVTQTGLNLALTGPDLHSYWFLLYGMVELGIFAVEMTVFALALREHKWYRNLACAFTANLSSLILGGWLISNLPV